MNCPPSNLIGDFITRFGGGDQWTGGAPPNMLRPSDPNRVYLRVSVASAAGADIWILPSNTVDIGDGIHVVSGTIDFELTYHDAGPLVGSEWWIAANNGTEVWWLETVYVPQSATPPPPGG